MFLNNIQTLYFIEQRKANEAAEQRCHSFPNALDVSGYLWKIQVFTSLGLMKPALFFLFLFTTLIACNSDKKSSGRFHAIDFSYFDISPEAFSLRVTQQDSVFVKQYFSSNSEGQLKDSSVYLGLLKGGIKQQFDSLMAVINFSKLDSLYETGHNDGVEYRLYIEGNTINTQFYIHSIRPPKELESLKNLFLKMKRSLEFVPVDTTISFRVNPPQPPPIKQSPSR